MPPPPSPFNVRVELLVNSWVGGQAEGREVRQQWTVLLYAGEGKRERERVRLTTEWKRLVSMLGNETRGGGLGGGGCSCVCWLVNDDSVPSAQQPSLSGDLWMPAPPSLKSFCARMMENKTRSCFLEWNEISMFLSSSHTRKVRTSAVRWFVGRWRTAASSLSAPVPNGQGSTRNRAPRSAGPNVPNPLTCSHSVSPCLKGWIKKRSRCCIVSLQRKAPCARRGCSLVFCCLFAFHLIFEILLFVKFYKLVQDCFFLLHGLHWITPPHPQAEEGHR